MKFKSLSPSFAVGLNRPPCPAVTIKWPFYYLRYYFIASELSLGNFPFIGPPLGQRKTTPPKNNKHKPKSPTDIGIGKHFTFIIFYCFSCSPKVSKRGPVDLVFLGIFKMFLTVKIYRRGRMRNVVKWEIVANLATSVFFRPPSTFNTTLKLSVTFNFVIQRNN